MDEDDFGGDMLLSVLTTDEGESITSVLAKLSDATEAIGKHLEKQNLILVKIPTPPRIPGPFDERAITLGL